MASPCPARFVTQGASPAVLPAFPLRALTLLALILLAGLSGCERRPEVRFFPPEAYPERLSEWGLMRRRGQDLVLAASVEPYEVNTPLFSDYALKLRTFHVPDGATMRYRERGSFEFPVGSIVTKTFFYPLTESSQAGVVQAASGWDGDVQRLDLDRYRLVETRLLVRQPHGWDALPYVWQGDDAVLKVTGALEPLRLVYQDESQPLPYVVPGRSECAGCHATDHGDGALTLIGLKARHLNRPYPGGSANQLTDWHRAGRLIGLPALTEVPRAAAFDDPGAALEQRARAYLDSNCGHCHSPTGAADTSGLLLDAHTDRHRQLGLCKPPIAAGRGTGGHPYSIVPGEPERSILLYRMRTDDPATRMPETGRAVVHREGVELIRNWIAALPGECV